MAFRGTTKFNHPSRKCDRNPRPRARRCRAQYRDWRWQCDRRRTSAAAAPRCSCVAAALDRLVLRLPLDLGIADHLVLLPAWRRTLKSPPVSFALARPFSDAYSDAWAWPHTNAANRSAVQTAVRRRSKVRQRMVLAKASLPQSDYPLTAR